MIRFLFIQSPPYIQAWDIPQPKNYVYRPDQQIYIKLLLRAVSTVLKPFGMDDAYLYRQVLKKIYTEDPLVRQPALFKRYKIARA